MGAVSASNRTKLAPLVLVVAGFLASRLFFWFIADIGVTDDLRKTE